MSATVAGLVTGPAAGPVTSPAGRDQVLRWLGRGVVLLLSLAVVDYLVLPQISGTRHAAALLDVLQPGWVVAGVCLEAASLVCFSLLTRALLPERALGLWWVVRADVTGLGVSHLLPGGGATATALRYRLLRRGGANGEWVAVALAVEGVLTTLVLAVLVWLALVVSIFRSGGHPVHLTAAVVGAVAIDAVVVAVALHDREAGPAGRVVARAVAHLPRRVRPRVSDTVEEASTALHRLLADRTGLRGSLLWAAGSCLLDAGSLWVFLAAYGHRLNPLGLFVAYGAGTLLAVLPISPGGLGVIEAVLIPSLVGLGSTSAVAVLGVVSWRLFQFWAPIPCAAPCYLSLRAQSWWEGRRRTRAAPPRRRATTSHT